MNDISSSIKKVLIVFLVCFFSLISYMTYFELFVGPKIVNRPENKKKSIKRNEVLRGTIFDRNKVALTKSSRINEQNQKENIQVERYLHM